MTPMFSAYVVVGPAPTKVAIIEPAPSAAIARPRYGSSFSPVISATAFTWPVFSAISAMTTGSETSTNARLNVGRWNPTTLVAALSSQFDRSLTGGRPNQLALFTLVQSTRKWVVILQAGA